MIEFNIIEDSDGAWVYKKDPSRDLFLSVKEDARVAEMHPSGRACVLIMDEEIARHIKDLVETMECIPEGFRLANQKDRQEEVPPGAKSFSQMDKYSTTIVSEWSPRRTYIVPEGILEEERTIQFADGTRKVLSEETYQKLRGKDV